MLFNGKRVYVAAKFQDKDRASNLASVIAAQGGIICSSWLTREYPEAETLAEKVQRTYEDAELDAREVAGCEVFILLDYKPVADHWKDGGLYSMSGDWAGMMSGGRFVELGIAIALGKFIIVEHKGGSIFDHLADIEGLSWISEVSLSSRSNVSTQLSSQSSRVLCLSAGSQTLESSTDASGSGSRSRRKTASDLPNRP